MAAIWLWARSDWRHRRGSLIGLALLIALSAGVALGVAGGARRAATAVDRFQATTNWQNVEVEISLPEEGAVDRDIARLPTAPSLADEIAAVPGVRGVTVMSWIGATPDPDGFFFNGALSAARGAAPTSPVVRGRSLDPAAPDEVIVNEAALEDWDIELGDTVTLHTLAPEQWEQFIGLEVYDPKGPDVDMRVVGVMRDLESITDRPEPWLAASPAFVERWSGEVIGVPGIAAVYADPAAVDDVVTALNGIGDGLYEAGVVDEDYVSRIADTIDVEVATLWTFAVAAGLAGLIIVGQALFRHATRGAAEHRAMAAMGLGPRQQALGSIVAVAPALVGGGVAALALAVAVSPLFPRGVARQAEIDPGVRIDWEVLLIGAAAIGATLLLVAFVAGILASRPGPASLGSAKPTRGERLLAAMPTVPGLGARLALRRSRGAAGTAWAAAGAVAIGVAGVVTVATVDRSVEHLLTVPSLYGAPWDLEAGLEPGAGADVEALAADPDVDMVASQRMAAPDDGEMTAHGPGGTSTVEPFTFDVALGPVPLVVDEGRIPGPGEAAVGAEVLDRLGASVGDTIEVEGFAGPVSMTIVGRSINPGNDELDQGFYVPPETFDSLLADCEEDDDRLRCRADVHGVGVALRAGADVDGALDRLREIEPALAATPRPSVVDSLAEIGSTPRWLGAFLAAFGLAGLAHALLSGNRRSRHDLAVVRALGLRPRQAASAVRWGAALVTLAGVAVGVLLGLVVGRVVWQRVVTGVGALFDEQIPVLALVGISLAAVVAALLIAIIPGRRAASLCPGAVLRAE